MEEEDEEEDEEERCVFDNGLPMIAFSSVGATEMFTR